MTGDLSGGSELLNAFRERSRWQEAVEEHILQGEQHFCRTAPNNGLLQGMRDASRRFLGKIENFQQRKMGVVVPAKGCSRCCLANLGAKVLQ